MSSFQGFSGYQGTMVPGLIIRSNDRPWLIGLHSVYYSVYYSVYLGLTACTPGNNSREQLPGTTPRNNSREHCLDQGVHSVPGD